MDIEAQKTEALRELVHSEFIKYKKANLGPLPTNATGVEMWNFRGATSPLYPRLLFVVSGYLEFKGFRLDSMGDKVVAFHLGTNQRDYSFNDSSPEFYQSLEFHQ